MKLNLFSCIALLSLSFRVMALSNGIIIPENQELAVVKIMDALPYGKTLGTGVFVGPDVILTAEHCVGSKNINNIIINDDIIPIDVLYPDFIEERVRLDLALIRVNFKTKKYMDIASSQLPQVGEVVDLIGYGPAVDSQGKDDNSIFKRRGFTKIFGVNETYLNIFAEGGPYNPSKQSYTLPGDSGGPMIFKNFVVGIASKGGLPGVSNHINLASSRTRDFLQSAIKKGWNIKMK